MCLSVALLAVGGTRGHGRRGVRPPGRTELATYREALDPSHHVRRSVFLSAFHEIRAAAERHTNVDTTISEIATI